MRKFKVVVTDYNYQNIDIERRILDQPDIDLIDCHCRTEEEVIMVGSDCDVLVVQFAPITRKVIESLTQCKMIIRYAIGVDNIDLKAATEKGIYVANVPDYGIDEVSTHAVTLLLAAARKLPQTISFVKENRWDYALVKPLHRTLGSRLGLVGLGRIPCDVAKKMSGFGLDIVAYDPYADQARADVAGVRLMGFDELIETSDYVSVHCPLTDETRGMFNRQVFLKMKRTAILVNTARGAVINEADLAEACASGEICAAAVDVTEKEPISPDSPLLKLDNVIITPHMAWYTEESIDSLKTKLAQDVLRVIRGEPPVNLVNKEVLGGQV